VATSPGRHPMVPKDGDSARSSRDRAALLVAQGYPKTDVARLAGIGRSSLYRWLAEPGFRAEGERLADEFKQDPTEALDVQAAAALASVLADPGATNSEKIRAATAVERLLASGAKKHSAAAPVGEQQKRRLVVTEMPADPDPDAEYEVATPEQRAAFRKGFEKAAKNRFPEGTDQSEIDAWVDQSVQRLCMTIVPDSGGRRRSHRAS
jgi:AcrR family transcriptional regulator